MQEIARLVLLTVAAQVRAVGSLPWIAFVLWGITAAVGEPVTLRTFGISIAAQATWCAAMVLVAVLIASVPQPAVVSSALLASVATVGIVAVSQAMLTAALELAHGRAVSLAALLLRASHFLVVGAPLAFILVAGSLRPRGVPARGHLRVALVVLGGATTVALAALPPQELCSTKHMLAGGLTMLGAMLAVACPRSAAMIGGEAT